MRMPDGERIDPSQLVESSPVAIIVIDAGHRVTYWNQACAQLTGVPAEAMLGRNEQWRAFYHKKRPILADLMVDGALEHEIKSHYPDQYHRSAQIDGAWEVEDYFPAFGDGDGGRWVHGTAAALRNADGEIVGAIQTLQDITEQRQAEAALRDSDAFQAEIINGSSVAMLVIDENHCLTHWNRACEIMTGKPAREMIGASDLWRVFYPTPRPILADLVLDGASENIVDRYYHGRYRPSPVVRGGYEVEDFFPDLGDSGRWLFFTAAPLRNIRGGIVGAIETFQDVTERRRAEEVLRESEQRYRRLSLTDSLTGLFNSRHLNDRLLIEIERAERYDRHFSLVFVDCDNFKGINDQFGHVEGDRVLQTLAGVIGHCLRSTDSAYRYGGEEFVLLLPEVGAKAAYALAERLRGNFAALEIPAANGGAMRCTVSVGITEYLPGDSSAVMMRRADGAVYRAKEMSKNRVVMA